MLVVAILRRLVGNWSSTHSVYIDKAIQQCWGIGEGLVWGASKATFLHCFQTDPLPVLNLGIEMKLTKAIIHVHALGL